MTTDSITQDLSSEFGRGFSTTNLKLMRKFYSEFRCRIGQTLPDQSPEAGSQRAELTKILQTVSAESRNSFTIS